MTFLSDIYRLAYIVRYSNIPKIRSENVAEHSFFVSTIVLDLYERYSFDAGKALLAAMSHDIPEYELNDCPHIIKKKYPSIAKAFKECEAKVYDTLPTKIKEGLDIYYSDTVEGKIVHLADVIQCKQYAESEIKLGNTGYMTKVYMDSCNRIKVLEKGLLPWKR